MLPTDARVGPSRARLVNLGGGSPLAFQAAVGEWARSGYWAEIDLKLRGRSSYPDSAGFEESVSRGASSLLERKADFSRLRRSE